MHVVDLFLAPRYFKKTKHVEQEAVSISKHMKDLAINQGLLEACNERNGKNGKKADAPNLWMQGRALQTALHEYLRDVVGLAGVKRGSPKRLVGNDWMPAEQLDIERRQEAVAAAEIKVAEAGREASAKLSEAEELRQVILAEKQAATTAMQHAEALQRGMLAFASGEIVGANERSGKQVLSFRDVGEKVYPLVLPAFDAVWRFVVKAMDRIRDMLKSAAEDKEQAAKIRHCRPTRRLPRNVRRPTRRPPGFEDAQQAAGRLLTEAAAMNDAALLEKKKAKEATDAANMARLAAAAERVPCRMSVLTRNAPKGRDAQ